MHIHLSMFQVVTAHVCVSCVSSSVQDGDGVNESISMVDFACTHVNVSYAIANDNGRSAFGTPTPLCVSEGTKGNERMCD